MRLLNLFETQNTSDAAKELVMNYYDMNQYPIEFIIEFFHDNNDELDGYGIQDPYEVDIKVNEFPELEKSYHDAFGHWVEQRVDDISYYIKNWLKNNNYIYREIVANENWVNDICKQPLGTYWSMDQETKEQWGDPSDDFVYFKMTARIPPINDIDMSTTIAQNAIDDYADEQEIKLIPNALVDVVRVEYRHETNEPWVAVEMNYPIRCHT